MRGLKEMLCRDGTHTCETMRQRRDQHHPPIVRMQKSVSMCPRCITHYPQFASDSIGSAERHRVHTRRHSRSKERAACNTGQRYVHATPTQFRKKNEHVLLCSRKRFGVEKMQNPQGTAHLIVETPFQSDGPSASLRLSTMIFTAIPTQAHPRKPTPRRQ